MTSKNIRMVLFSSIEYDAALIFIKIHSSRANYNKLNNSGFIFISKNIIRIRHYQYALLILLS